MDDGITEVTAALRATRDQLLAQLAILDGLGERMASIELSSAIEILNERLGEPTDQAEVDRLARRLFGN